MVRFLVNLDVQTVSGYIDEKLKDKKPKLSILKISFSCERVANDGILTCSWPSSLNGSIYFFCTETRILASFSTSIWLKYSIRKS